MIAEIVFAMQLFKTELNEMDNAEVIIHQDKKDKKVKCVQITAISAMVCTLGELILRAIIKDYIVGHCIFVGELFIVGSLMLYFTMRFSRLVDDVQKTLGVNFVDEKN